MSRRPLLSLWLVLLLLLLMAGILLHRHMDVFVKKVTCIEEAHFVACFLRPVNANRGG